MPANASPTICCGAQIQAELRDTRRSCTIPRGIAEMVEGAAIALRRAAEQRSGNARNGECSQERKLEAGVGELRGTHDENEKRRYAHGIEQCRAAKQQPGKQVNCRHGRRAHNRRAVLNDGQVEREGGEHEKRGRREGQAQGAADPE